MNLGYCKIPHVYTAMSMHDRGIESTEGHQEGLPVFVNGTLGNGVF